MGSPFPGMDPFLEHPGYWQGFHVKLATAIEAQLNANLPVGYSADSHQGVRLVEDSGRSQGLVPDVGVCDLGYVFDADTGGAALVPAEACPEYRVPEPIATLVAARQEANAIAYAEAVARLEGVPMMAYAPPDGPATMIPGMGAANATPVPAMAADATALDALFQRLLGP